MAITAVRENETPENCVAPGTHFWEKPMLCCQESTWVLNLVNSMWLSRTLTAAKQVVPLGIRGIALGTSSGNLTRNGENIESYLEKVLTMLLRKPDLYLMNVNFPGLPEGIRWTRQSVRFYDGKVVPGKDPMGRKHYWFTVVPLEQAEEGTDRWAVDHHFVSITPLRLDLTNEIELRNAVLKQPVEGPASII